MAETGTLSAVVRERGGKGASRQARREGKVPGIVYGGGEAPLSVSVEKAALLKALHQPGFFARLHNLSVDGKPVRVLARDVQLDPVSDAPIHVDFMRITKDARVTVEIPVRFINDQASPGIKRGGVLNIVRHEIEVECPADAIPDQFTVDLTGLEINDSVHISQIALPQGVKPTITERDFTVATIAAPTLVVEEEAAPAEAAEGEAAAAEAAAEGAEEASEEKEKEKRKRNRPAAAVRLVVGLGNPGPAYRGHRHNVGFMAVDRIAADHGFGPFRARFRGEAAEGQFEGQKVLVLKPMTMMNLSGESVGEAARFHKLSPADVIVFHDELDLAPGKVRAKQGGGNGGHNGLRDIDRVLGPDYWRVRIGIGHPGNPDRVTNYVLNDFSADERLWLAPLLSALSEAFPLLVAGDASRFMTKVALLAPPPDNRPDSGTE